MNLGNDPANHPAVMAAEAFRQQFLADTRLEARDALRAIIAAYDKAVIDGEKLPTTLMCAIECARGVL